MKVVSWIILLLCCIPLAFSKPAEAGKCADFYNLEASFVKVDTVFSGTPLSMGHEVLFNADTYYKSPLNFKEMPEKIKVYSGDLNFQKNQEYIIFGNLRQKEGEEKIVISYSCLGTKLIAEEYIKILREQKEIPNYHSEKIDHVGDFIFTGVVKKIEHEEASSSLARPFVRSKITFFVKDFYKYPDTQKNISAQKDMSISVNSCGQAYRVGETYLIIAQGDPSSDQGLRGHCAWPTGWMLGEKDYLGSLVSK